MNQGDATADRHQAAKRQGEYWTLVFAGRTCQLRDTIGLRCLAFLLARPGESISALDIQGHAATDRDAAPPAPDGDGERRAALERARVNVTRALRAVLKRIDDRHPELSAHLRATVHTGASCAYTPDPRLAVGWYGETGEPP